METTAFARCRNEAPDEQGILYFLHGLADHFGRWNHLGNFLLENNISFYSHDQRGHGKTEIGPRAYIEDFNIFVEDTIKQLEEVKKEKPDTPIILMGHSMGGLISVMVALERPDLLDGVVLSAPYLKLSDNVSPFMKKLAWGLSSWVPKLYMPWNSLDREKLTPDLEQRQRDAEDPLIWHAGVRAGFAVEMFKALDSTKERFGDLKVKTVIFHGEKDDICDIAGSRSLLNAKPDLVTLVRYEYPYHSLLHLLPEDRKRVMTDVTKSIKDLCADARKE